MTRLLLVNTLVCLVLACNSSKKPLTPPGAPVAVERLQTATPPTSMRKDGSMLGLKPYFTVRVSSVGSVGVEVYLNGGFAVMDATYNQIDEVWPVNPLLASGANELAVQLQPFSAENGKPAYFDPDALVTVTLRVRPADAEEGEEQVVSTLQVRPAQSDDRELTAGSTEPGSFASEAKFVRKTEGDVRISAPRVDRRAYNGRLVVTQTIDTLLPFPTWAFLRSDTLPPRQEQREEEIIAEHNRLLTAYTVVWQKLAARDVDGLMPLFEERSRENDQAFFFPQGTTQRKLRAAFEQALADQSRRLGTIAVADGEYWRYAPGLNGKLRRLAFGDRSEAIIRFEDKEDESYLTQFPITFRKQGGRYIVAR